MYNYNCLITSKTEYMGKIGVSLYAWAILFIRGFDFEGKKERERERQREREREELETNSKKTQIECLNIEKEKYTDDIFLFLNNSRSMFIFNTI